MANKYYILKLIIGVIIMVNIHNDTFIPYEFSKQDAYNYIVERCHGCKKSLRFLELTTEHLYVRCPIVGDYLDIVAPEEELLWLHEKLTKNKWYRVI